MPDIVGRLRPPRLAAAPASPAVGEIYYNTTTNVLQWWSGSAWVTAAPTTQTFPRTYADLTNSATTGVPVRT